MNPKLLFLFLLIGSVAVSVLGDAGAGAAADPEVPDNSNLLKELAELKKVKSNLEVAIKEKNAAIHEKEQTLEDKKKLLKEKEDMILSLTNEIEIAKSKGAGDLEAETSKSRERVAELQKQVETLEASLKEKQSTEALLKSRLEKAHKEASEYSVKYEKLQNVLEEQKVRMQKTETSLKSVEKKMKRYQEEAQLKKDELSKVHSAWLPAWLDFHLAKYQELAKVYWEKHGKPAISEVHKMTSEKAAVVQEWARPHLETVAAKWAPALKHQWEEALVIVGPHVENFKKQATDVYEKSSAHVKPHLVTAYAHIDPHIQALKAKCSPYVEHVVSVSQPHVEKAKLYLEPYSKHVTKTYRRFLTRVTKHHRQLQKNLMEGLKKHEFTRSFATKELVWFMASAVLALPIYILWKTLSSFFSSSNRKVQKPSRGNHAGHAHKKHKRRHADK